MRPVLHAATALDASLVRLQQEHVVELRVDDLDGLMREPDLGPFESRRGPYRSGIDDVAMTLCAAPRLPAELTVRVVLAPQTAPSATTEQAKTSMQQRAVDAASLAWREAMAIRAMGRRQLPLGIAIALAAVVIAYGAGYLATTVDSDAVRGLLFVVFGVAITVAWVFSWMVVEAAFIDWRQPSRRARAYDLIARADLEVVIEPTRPTVSQPA
jgi:hypothetical protein